MRLIKWQNVCLPCVVFIRPGFFIMQMPFGMNRFIPNKCQLGSLCISKSKIKMKSVHLTDSRIRLCNVLTYHFLIKRYSFNNILVGWEAGCNKVVHNLKICLWVWTVCVGACARCKNLRKRPSNLLTQLVACWESHFSPYTLFLVVVWLWGRRYNLFFGYPLRLSSYVHIL